MRLTAGFRPSRSAALLGLALLLVVGCEQASRYGPTKLTGMSPLSEPKPSEPLPPHYAWLEPNPVDDNIPIVFVDSASQPKEWQQLTDFWNHFPPPGAGAATAHIGMSPLGALLALKATPHLDVIKIKVPLGLPNPTAEIPPSNPPTYAKWRLGKRLFFDNGLLGSSDLGSCASCHRPEEGFTQRLTPVLHPRMMDTLSLINCVYNKSQFWDGRVATLEEVIQRRLEDERPAKVIADRALPQYPHIWSGIIQRLSKNSPGRLPYRIEFESVFGISQPTQDAVGKALATYMRTILSGNSLYDRAVQAAGRRDDGHLLKAKDFEPLLDDATLARLDRTKARRADVASEVEKGYSLFHGQAGCATCHKGWNFTDNSFHNIGIRESDSIQEAGKEYGRFHHQPIGLKDARMIGAFRTPTLRNLPRTGPFFHAIPRRTETVEDVVQYYNKVVDAEFNTYLDPALLASPKTPKRLELSTEDVRALVLFLTALDGDPVSAIISGRP